MSKLPRKFGVTKFNSLFSLAAIPTVLIVIAGLQLYNAHFNNMSPWKGGGFGMFSTIDRPEARFLRCYLATDTGHLPVAIPSHLQHLARDVQAMPTVNRLNHLATQLAQETRARRSSADGAQHIPAPDDTTPDLPVLSEGTSNSLCALPAGSSTPVTDAAYRSVHIEVWRQDFHAPQQQVTATLILAASVEQ